MEEKDGTTDAAAGESRKKAFEEFMLGGRTRSRKISNNSSGSSNNNNNNKSSPATSTPKTPPQIKRIVSIIKAFQETLVREWLDVDHNLYLIMSSISNLREQCCETNHRLIVLRKNKGAQSQKQQHQQHDRRNQWSGYGYRNNIMTTSTTSLFLQQDDLEMALTNALLQHERMITTGRQLLSNLGQVQEALGRRLDELLTFLVYNYNAQGLMRSASSADDENRKDNDKNCKNDDDVVGDDDDDDVDVLKQVDECQELFHATASELYRKQTLAVGVLDETSAQDSLLLLPPPLIIASSPDDCTTASMDPSGGSDIDKNSQLQHPLHCAQRCKEVWSIRCSRSHLFPYLSLLEQIKQKYGA